jgi:hypothetical protein
VTVRLETAIFYGPLVASAALACSGLIVRQRNLGFTLLAWMLIGVAATIAVLWTILLFTLAAGGL